MQRRNAFKYARALVVLSSDRWTKMLVRRQAHAVEIVAGMAKASIPATRFRRKSHNRGHGEARQSIGLASLGTEGV